MLHERFRHSSNTLIVSKSCDEWQIDYLTKNWDWKSRHDCHSRHEETNVVNETKKINKQKPTRRLRVSVFDWNELNFNKQKRLNHVERSCQQKVKVTGMKSYRTSCIIYINGKSLVSFSYSYVFTTFYGQIPFDGGTWISKMARLYKPVRAHLQVSSQKGKKWTGFISTNIPYQMQ